MVTNNSSRSYTDRLLAGVTRSLLPALLVVGAALALPAEEAKAQTCSGCTIWLGTTSKDWNTASNWSSGIPNNTTRRAVIAQSGYSFNRCISKSVNSDSEVYLTSGTIVDGTADPAAAGGCGNTGAPQRVPGCSLNNGTSCIQAVSVSATNPVPDIPGAGATAPRGLTVSSSASLVINNGNLTVLSNSNATYGAASQPVLDNAGTFTINASRTVAVTGSSRNTNSFTHNGTSFTTSSDFTSSGTTNLNASTAVTGTSTISGGTTTVATSQTFDTDSTVSISGGATLTVNGQLDAGTISNSGTFNTPSGSTVRYTGASPAVLSRTWAGNLHLVNSGTATAAGAITVSGDFVVNAAYSDSDNLTLNNINLQGSGNLNLGSGTHSIAGTTTWSGALTASSATVSFTGAGAQSVPAVAFGTLTKSGAGTLTITNGASATTANANGGTFLVPNSASFTATTFNVGGGTLQVGQGTSGTLNVNGELARSSGTITFNAGSLLNYGGAGSFSMPGSTTFQSVTINKSSGTISQPAAATAINGALTMTAGGFSSNASNALTVGSISQTGGTLTANGTVNVTSGVTQSTAGTITIETAGIIDTTTFNNGSGTTLDMNGSAQLKVSAAGTSFTRSGTFTPDSTSTVEYDGTGAQTIASGSFGGLRVNKASGTASLSGGTTVAGALNVSAGTLDLASNTANVTGASTVSSGATLNLVGILNANGGFSSAGTTTVNASSALDTTDMTLSAGTLSTAAGSTISVSGNASFSISPSLANSTFTYDGSGSQNVAPASYHTLTINKSAGTATLTGTASAANTTTVQLGTFSTGANTFTASAGTVIESGGTLAVASGGTYNATGSFTTNSGGTLSLTGQINFSNAFTSSGTFTANSGSTARFTGTGSASVPGLTYHNLSLNKSTGATLAGTTTIDGNLLVEASSVASFGSQTVNLAGNLTTQSGASLDSNGSTLNLTTGTGAISLASPSTTPLFFVNVNAGSKSMATNMSVLDITFSTSGALDPGANTLTVVRDYTDSNTSGGLANTSGSSLVFSDPFNAVPNSVFTYNNGSGRDIRALTVGDGTNPKNLTFACTGCAGSQSVINVSGNVTINANGTLNSNSTTLSLTGDWNNLGTHTATTNSGIALNGTGAQSFRGNFQNLQIAKSSGTATAAANFTCTNSLYIASGTLNTGSRTLVDTPFSHTTLDAISDSGSTLQLAQNTRLAVTGTLNLAGAMTVGLKSHMSLGTSSSHALGDFTANGAGSNGANRFKIYRNGGSGYFSMTMSGDVDMEDGDFYNLGNVGGVDGLLITGDPSTARSPTSGTTNVGINFISFFNLEPGTGRRYVTVNTPSSNAWGGTTWTGVSFRKPTSTVTLPSSEGGEAEAPTFKQSAGEISLDNQDSGTISLDDPGPGGELMGSGTESGSVDWGTSNAELVYMAAKGLRSRGQVSVQWTTASETDNLGFNVLRAESAAGPYTIVSSFIPGAGTTVTSNNYSFVDSLAGDAEAVLANGGTFFYAIEDVDFNGITKRWGPVRTVWVDGIRNDTPARDDVVAAAGSKGSSSASGLTVAKRDSGYSFNGGVAAYSPALTANGGLSPVNAPSRLGFETVSGSAKAGAADYDFYVAEGFVESGDVTVRLVFGRNDIDHAKNVTLELNGEAVPAEMVIDTGARTAEFRVPAAWLQSGHNTLTVWGAKADVAASFDAYEVSYPVIR